MRFQHLFAKPLRLFQEPLIPSDWRILITGITSIHGWPIYEALRRIMPTDNLRAVRPPKMLIPAGEHIRSLCISDQVGLKKIQDEFQPTHVIYASGVCDLDVCEERPEWADKINHQGAQAVAEIFGSMAYILFLSTDIVYSGNHPPAGGYREDHAPDPISMAGKTFAAGERAILETRRHCLLRLGLPIGASVNSEIGAVDYVAGRFKRGLPFTLFHDELRSCISCEEIKEITLRVLAREAQGIFHCGGREPVDLHELGKSIIQAGGYPEHLLSTMSRLEEVKGPPRIGNVALNSGKLLEWLERNYEMADDCRKVSAV